MRVLLAVLLVALSRVAGAQETAPALTPRHLELSVPSAPMTMLAPDAQRLVERLGSARAVQPPPIPPPPSGGVSRTIMLPHPPLANPSSQMLFEDVTDRREPAAAQVPMEQRRAAVEAVRQSLDKQKRARR